MTTGEGRAREHPGVEFALTQLADAGIAVTEEGQTEIRSLYFAGWGKDKKAAEAKQEGFASRLVQSAQRANVTDINALNFRQVKDFFCPWSPFCD
jgi:hypothetical protein